MLRRLDRVEAEMWPFQQQESYRVEENYPLGKSAIGIEPNPPEASAPESWTIRPASWTSPRRAAFGGIEGGKARRYFGGPVMHERCVCRRDTHTTCDSEQPDPERARLGNGGVGKGDADAQVAADHVDAERVSEEGIVSALEAMRRALRSERIDIGQRITGAEYAEIDIGGDGSNVARPHEVTHE